MEAPERLRGRDYALLLLFCVALFGFPLLNDRVLTTHETVHCENAREMRTGGDWIMPHYGGRPWPERPPLPFWITVGVLEVLGDSPLAYRLAALLMGVPCVLLVAWMASVWYGRGVGTAAGLILATMQEFTHYCTGPEADIFLCTVVTVAVAWFVHLEFSRRPAEEEDCRWLGRRPWPVLLFFVFLGLTNLVKGLFFGTLFVLLPVLCFLTASGDLRALRRYAWLWGWLACLAVAAAWPVAAYLRYPDIVDFWKSDYLGRVNQGYMREPFWYYFANLPVVIFPWSLPAFVGLWLTHGAAWRQRSSAERFLWCWAVVPIMFFSIPQGKHHHYLLQCMAPWAVLAALGAVRLWQMGQHAAWLQRQWQMVLVLGLAGDAALAALGARIPGPPWLVPALLVAWPLCVYLVCWAVVQPNGRVALGTLCSLCVVLYAAGYAYRTAFWDRYRDDTAFVQEALTLTPPGQRVLVMDDDAPLNASWLLFYVGERAKLLHNLTFLLGDDVSGPDVYLIARRKTEKSLEHFGSHEVLAESRHSRYERTPADRYTLFHLRFHDRLPRQPGVRISPMQATGRAPGPYLCDWTDEGHNNTQ